MTFMEQELKRAVEYARELEEKHDALQAKITELETAVRKLTYESEQRRQYGNGQFFLAERRRQLLREIAASPCVGPDTAGYHTMKIKAAIFDVLRSEYGETPTEHTGGLNLAWTGD